MLLDERAEAVVILSDEAVEGARRVSCDSQAVDVGRESFGVDAAEPSETDLH